MTIANFDIKVWSDLTSDFCMRSQKCNRIVRSNDIFRVPIDTGARAQYLRVYARAPNFATFFLRPSDMPLEEERPEKQQSRRNTTCLDCSQLSPQVLISSMLSFFNKLVFGASSLPLALQYHIIGKSLQMQTSHWPGDLSRHRGRACARPHGEHGHHGD